MKYPFISKKLDEYSNYFDNISRSYQYTNYLCVNAKLYFWPDASDLPAALNLGNVTDEVRDFLIENVTDKQVNRWFDWWIDGQRDYLREWVDGCQYADANYWNSEIKKLKETGQTSYYKIDGEARNKASVQDLLAYKKDNVYALDKLEHFEGEKCYFVGGSGGWFAFSEQAEAQQLIDEVENRLYDIRESTDRDEIISLEQDAFIALRDLLKFKKGCQFIIDEVESQIECAEESFKHELLYRATETDYLKELGFVSEDDEIEMKLQSIAV